MGVGEGQSLWGSRINGQSQMLRDRNEIVSDLNTPLVEEKWKVRKFGFSFGKIWKKRRGLKVMLQISSNRNYRLVGSAASICLRRRAGRSSMGVFLRRSGERTERCGTREECW